MTGTADETGPVAFDTLARRLAAAGIEDARREVRLLARHAAGLDSRSSAMEMDIVLDRPARDRLDSFVARREAREPLSHIVGSRGFWTLELEVGPAVLDPRPDSETLVMAALDIFPDTDAPLSVLDLGTGSGCLLLAVLVERPRALGLGIDISSEALAIARRNAVRAGLGERVRLQRGDWGTDIDEKFDLVLCNPPYVRHDEISSLMPEIAGYEPRIALDGGADGLDAYRRVAPQIARLLVDSGTAVIEAGAGQIFEIKDIFSNSGLAFQACRMDYGGIERAGVFGHARRLTNT